MLLWGLITGRAALSVADHLKWSPLPHPLLLHRGGEVSHVHGDLSLLVTVVAWPLSPGLGGCQCSVFRKRSSPCEREILTDACGTLRLADAQVLFAFYTSACEMEVDLLTCLKN